MAGPVSGRCKPDAETSDFRAAVTALMFRDHIKVMMPVSKFGDV